MMNTLCVMAHKENFFELRGLLDSFIREVNYPTREDPSYLIRAEVPEGSVAELRSKILQVTGRR